MSGGSHLALLCLALLVIVTLSLLEPLKEPFVHTANSGLEFYGVWSLLHKSYRPPCMLSTLPFAAVLHRHHSELTVSSSPSDGELESRHSSGYSSAEASPECLPAWGQASDSVTTTAKCLSSACCVHGTVPDFRLVLQSFTLSPPPSKGIGV